MYEPLTPAQKPETKKHVERRRRERRKREDEYRRRIERLRRQIEEARKRRQLMLLLFLLAVLAMQESILAAFGRSYSDWPDPISDREDWTPSPENDFAPAPGCDDNCDGYSRTQWNRMLDERGIRVSRKAEMKAAWEVDPDYDLYPQRYREWGHRPYIGQIMAELTAPYWRTDAFTALKLLSPPETHQYLAEAYATDPGDLRQCLADRDSDIIQAFQTRAILWEERKRREAEEAKREQELSRKNAGDQGIPDPN